MHQSGVIRAVVFRNRDAYLSKRNQNTNKGCNGCRRHGRYRYQIFYTVRVHAVSGTGVGRHCPRWHRGRALYTCATIRNLVFVDKARWIALVIGCCSVINKARIVTASAHVEHRTSSTIAPGATVLSATALASTVPTATTAEALQRTVQI